MGNPVQAYHGPSIDLTSYYQDSNAYNKVLQTARKSGNSNRVKLLEDAYDAFVKQPSHEYHVVERLRNTKGETVGIIARLTKGVLEPFNIGKIFKFIR